MENTIPYKKIEIMVVPIDYCNMKCLYCFNNRCHKEYDRNMLMKEETFRKLCEIALPFYEEVIFLWHGGEPLSAGIDFYKRIIEIQNEYSHYAKISNKIQTNLTLMTTEFARFFIANNFGIGSSFDGINNEISRGCSKQILEGYYKVNNCGGNLGFIYVAQAHNINNLVEDYIWFKSKGINYTINQYKSQSSEDSLYVEPLRYADAICNLFDVWLSDEECNIRVSVFEDFVQYYFTGIKKLCCYNSCLGRHLGIYPNGDIYNCNRDFSKEYCFGNVYDYKNIHECFSSRGFNSLLDSAYKRRKNCKENCEIYSFCLGGCNSDSIIFGDILKGNNDVCTSLKVIIFHINKMLDNIKDEYQNKKEIHINPYIKKYL